MFEASSYAWLLKCLCNSPHMLSPPSSRISSNPSQTLRVPCPPRPRISRTSSSNTRSRHVRVTVKPSEMLRLFLCLTECLMVFCKSCCIGWFDISSNGDELFRVSYNPSLWFSRITCNPWWKDSSYHLISQWPRVLSYTNECFRVLSNSNEGFRAKLFNTNWFRISRNPEYNSIFRVGFLLIGLIWISGSFASMEAFPLRVGRLSPFSPNFDRATSTLEESIGSLEQSVQSAAFQQFSRRSLKTGVIYNISVPFASSGTFQAIRVRSGSMRRHGITINEFSIPRGCILEPTYERVLLVYSRLFNTSPLERTLPKGLTFGSNVLSLFAYDATGSKNGSVSAREVSVTSMGRHVISIQFGGNSAGKCALFYPNLTLNSTLFNYIEAFTQGSCEIDHVGAVVALVMNASSPLDTPPSINLLNPAINVSIKSNRTNTWRVIVGFVFGALAALVLVILIALTIRRHVENTKLEKMEYRAEKGESLKIAKIQSSRVPAAQDIRTQPRLERDYWD